MNRGIERIERKKEARSAKPGEVMSKGGVHFGGAPKVTRSMSGTILPFFLQGNFPVDLVENWVSIQPVLHLLDL